MPYIYSSEKNQCVCTGKPLPKRLPFPVVDVVDVLETVISNQAPLGERFESWRWAPDGVKAGRAVARALRPFGFKNFQVASARVVAKMENCEWIVKTVKHPEGAVTFEREAIILEELAEKAVRCLPQTFWLSPYVALQENVPLIDEEAFEMFYEKDAAEIERMSRRLAIFDVAPTNVGWRKDGSFVFVDFEI